MHADDIRTLYDYHFALNRKLWDTSIMALTQEQFVQPLPYSIGSVRNQVVHLMDIEEGWFTGLRIKAAGREPFKNPEEWPTREKIRADWDVVEMTIRSYLDSLTDDEANALFSNEPKPVKNWQVMLHVLNHATDHRAQTLAMLHNLGAPTFPQDMIFHWWR